MGLPPLYCIQPIMTPVIPSDNSYWYKEGIKDGRIEGGLIVALLGGILLWLAW